MRNWPPGFWRGTLVGIVAAVLYILFGGRMGLIGILTWALIFGGAGMWVTRRLMRKK